MKLRNKKTGEIVDVPDTGFSAKSNPTGGYTSLYDYYGGAKTQPKTNATFATTDRTKAAPAAEVNPWDEAMKLGKGAVDVAGFVFPETVKGIKQGVAKGAQDLQQLQAGTYKPNMPTLQSVGASALGPLGMSTFGTPEQKQAMSAGAELAPMFMGGMSEKGLANTAKLIGPKAANLLIGKTGAQMAPRLMGAVSGGLRAAFKPDEVQPKTAGDLVGSFARRVGATALGTGLGFGTGMLMEGGRKVAEAVGKQASNTLHRLIRPNPTMVGNFEKNTGWKFGDEIAKRDAKNIGGMNWDQLKDYFTQKSSAANQVADQELAKVPATLPKQYFIGEIDKKIAELQPKAGRAMQDSAIAALEKAKEDIMQNPDDISLVVANQLKRDFQNAGEAAFGLTASDNPASVANAEISRLFKSKIEEKAPQIADINKVTQLYHLAKNSVIKRAGLEENKLANDWLGKLIAIAPVFGGMFGYSKGGIKGAAIGAGATSGMGGLRLISQSPEFQTILAKAAQGALSKAESKVVQGVTNFLTYQATQGTNAVTQAIMRQFDKQQPQIQPQMQNIDENGTLTTAE